MREVADLPYASKLVFLRAGGLSAHINPERGGDVLSLIHEGSNLEVLWRSKRADQELPKSGPLNQDISSFYDEYPGGIQELFPNTADSTLVDGAQLPFHGEACRVPWTVVGERPTSLNSVRLRTHLRRFPVKMERKVSLNSVHPILTIESTIENLSSESIPFSWAFHPAFGDALLSGGCTLYLPSEYVEVHPQLFSANQVLKPGSVQILERVGSCGALALRSGTDFGADLLYARCKQGWFIARNESSGLTVTGSWDIERMPFMWIWREFHDPTGYPWWGLEDIVGLEVHSSAPSQELRSLIESREASHLNSRQSLTASISLSIIITDISRKPIGVDSLGMPLLEGSK
jgi:hypothetical protein